MKCKRTTKVDSTEQTEQQNSRIRTRTRERGERGERREERERSIDGTKAPYRCLKGTASIIGYIANKISSIAGEGMNRSRNEA
jgi:hypothetical protein